jgi:hypothetical protein
MRQVIVGLFLGPKCQEAKWFGVGDVQVDI